ncbi:RHS repeat-associated core domain-containing protein [Xanthomonas albilineans]|uniref:RHS repeat-associated core domain-containing protein n=1 Tax=Xanthomonas albilineans TaxID=29447 RepID=UPI000A811C15|nr:RHS repeat-associated core domain-containing protein [Xanthomonas albilineans]
MRKSVFIFILVATSVLYGMPLLGKAQAVSQYCYNSCFGSLDEAEAEMRAALPYGAYLVRDKTIITEGDSSTPSYQINYKVRRQPPSYISPPGFLIGGNGPTSIKPAICTPNADPVLKDYCADESEMIQGWVDYNRSDCTLSDERIDGAYGEPFVQSLPYVSGLGMLTFDLPTFKWFRYNISCPGWDDPTPSPRDTTLVKTKVYSCPAGLKPVSAFNPAYNADVNPDVTAEYPYLCDNPNTPSIYAKGIDQTKSCAANANPCLPATGDKFRREDDLTFAGRPFQRFYHSRQQLQAGMGMAPGWSHSFSDLLGYDRTYMVTNEGFYEQFQKVGDGKYRGRRNAAEMMVRSDDGIWTLVTADGERRSYNANGRLVALQSSVSPAFDINFIYAGDKLSRAVDGLGHSLSFNYKNDVLDRVSLDDGSYVQYGYDDAQNLTSVTRSDGSVRVYRYGESGLVPAGRAHLLTGIEEDGARYATFGYADDGRVASSRLHANGAEVETTSIVYAGTTSAQVQQPNGASYTYQFGQGLFRQIEAISGPDGTTTMRFDAGRPIASTDKLGNSTQFSYQDSLADHDTSSSTTTVGVGTADMRSQTITRDSENRVVGQESHDSSGTVSLSRAVYSAGRVAFRCQYDTSDPNASAYVCGSMVSPPTTVRQVAYTYCTDSDVADGSSNCPSVGLLRRVAGPRTDLDATTNYTYYPSDDSACAASPTTCAHRKGDLWKVTNALGQVTEYLAYDGAGRVLSVKDANGVITDSTYHPRGWLTARKVRGSDDSTESDDRITRIDYWPTGLVKRITQPDGAFTAFTYDAAHRLTDIADNAGNTVHYTLDNAGNRLKEDTQDASGTLKRTLSRVYNQLGQLATQATASGNATGFGYDANGNTTQVTDALGHITQNDYDPLNRLAHTLQDVGGIAAQTTFAYDALDHVTQVTDPKGLDTTYAYNGLGDLTTLTSPDTGTTTYSYDSAGNRAMQTAARGVTATYSHDALNRLTSVAYPDASLNVSYSYDLSPSTCASGETYAVGRLTHMQDGSGSTDYCYDRFGNLVRKVQTVNGKAFVLRYAYTPSGQLSQLSYPDGAVVDYVRNAQGQTTEVGVTPAGGTRQVLLTKASYYPFGPVSGWTYGNGRPMQRVLDQDYRPQAISDTRSDGLAVGFAFDPAGNLSALTAPGNTAPVVSLDYDALGRLSAFKDGPTGAVIDGYTYDATGNRLSAQVNGVTQHYVYPADSHHLASVDGATRSYDAAGNTTSIGGTTQEFVYDDSARMRQAKRNGAVAMEYRYNGRGEQVQRFLGTNSTYTLYDEAGHWLGDYDGNGAPLQQAIWLDDLPVGVLAASNTLNYIQPDHLGSPRAVIDPVRDVAIWRWDLKGEAFGNTAPDQDPDHDGNVFVLNLRFPGQRYDAASGLNQNYFRDYEPGNGRYVQSDPIGLGGGINTYAYVESNPLLFNDLFALAKDQSCVAGYTVGGALCGGAIGTYGGGLFGGVGGGLLCSPSGPGAIACVAGGTAGGSTLGGAAGSAIGGVLGNLAGQTMCPDDECAKLIGKIDSLVSELKKRYSDLVIDVYGLPAIGPMSIAGHKQQFRNKQTMLRGLLNEAASKGCTGYSTDAWMWATMPAPR